MSFSPLQIAAHWVSGFTLLVMIFLIDIQNGRTLTNFLESLADRGDYSVTGV